MQKNIIKVLSIFLLTCFVMSMTAAAACSGGSCSATKATAKPDSFSLSSSKKCANVLSNDKGTGLKVTTTGYIKTAKGAKVYMKSNGYFCYTAKSCSTGTITDSFTYKIKDKYGKTSSAKVTIRYKCR